jgi:hypothetical protein
LVIQADAPATDGETCSARVATRAAIVAHAEPAVTTKYVSQADVLAALSKSRDVRLRTVIHVEGEYAAVGVVAVEYTTSRGDDLYAMYQTVMKEGNERCGR